MAGGEPAVPLNERDREDLIDELVARLRIDGVPKGAWLFDIGRVRAALREADELLLRLERAIEQQPVGD